jgi:cytochrome P450
MVHSTASEAAPIPSHVPPHLVFDFDVYNAAAPDQDFHLAIKRLHGPDVPEVFWTPRQGGHWVLTRGDDIYKAFADYEHFSSTIGLTVPKSTAPPIPLYPIFLDPPQHTKYRALLNPWFSPKSVASLEERAREVAKSIVREIKSRGRCDFVTEFAQHLPIQVFMSIVNVPSSDRERLLEWADGMVRPEKREDVHETIKHIFGYASQKIMERRANPGDDLISKLSQAEVDGKPMTHEELMGMVSLVLIGGMDTVVSAISFAANFLAASPKHRHQLLERPELIPKAVDELLRRFPVVNQGRTCVKDIEIKGAPIKAGDMIIMPTTLHGLDDRKFENPLEVDFERPTPIHSTFGNGPHRCPGSNLARTEMKIFLQEWLPEIPDFRHDPDKKAGMSSGVNATIYSLPLVWDVK